ncbi:MAG TPA: tetratricopeptide repeat protein [Ignavibacteriaceae bacterium]|nr:tetratricopeptide repeat protein [Ignavibacteriaceae bacterium]
MKYFVFILSLSVLILSCSKTSDKEYLDKGVAQLDQKKISEAITSFQNLIDEYPESALAPEAMLKIAQVYQNKLDTSLTGGASLKKAVDTFKMIFKNYPNSQQAPSSLFMAAFILANDLKNFNEATETYNLFLSKFPNDKLAPSAKEELENMGLSPEEILEKKISANK